MEKRLFYILLLFTAVSCREKYTPRIVTPPTGYLVVEGIINSGTGATNISLSRTNQITVDSLQYELGAIVQVEGNDNSIFYLDDKGNGQYHSDQLYLNSAQQYRLRIKTQDGREYLSDFVAVKTTPAIDTVRWQYQNDGVHFSLNTHDPSNNTRYYNWNYEETWEFQSPYIPALRFDTTRIAGDIIINIVPGNPDSTIITCWNTVPAPSILINTTTKLSEDIVDNYPLLLVPRGSVKLSILYSVLIKQYALTSDAYEFLRRMKKNTEQTGSVFDAQPSELKGNIHSTSNPGEIVVGYVSVSSEESKRIFINNTDVPDWGYHTPCSLDTFKTMRQDELRTAAGVGLIPIKFYGGGFLAAFPVCVDCTRSGTNQKPPFWP